jgi:prophage DNA circulation protein
VSWRDQLRPASFRGAAFFVHAADAGVGRRTVVHEYPLRDEPFVEDLGRRARSFTLKAYVLATPANGMNYMPARDALIAALEQPGSGVLVHPYIGELSVSCVEASFGETTEEGGKATFILTFVESGEAIFPSSAANTAAAVDQAADDAIAAAQADFTEVYTVDDLPEFVALSAKDLFKTVNTAIDEVIKSFPASPDELASFAPDLFAFAQGLDELIRKPITLAGTLVDLYGRIGTTLTRPIHAYYALKAVWKFGLDGTKFAVPKKPKTTPTRIQDDRNQTATLALTQRLAVIEAARIATDVDFTTFQDAATIRDELADELDRLVDGADDDGVYQALADLRAASVRDITARSTQLGRLVSYTPIATLPAVVIAYELYEDAGRDAEIVARNRVRHPGFVPGATPIEVLADA